MIVYSISSLLELSSKTEELSVLFPFLESFFGSYSQKVTEDQKTPLFSKTTKYNNFPVRCQWKGSSDKNKYKFNEPQKKISVPIPEISHKEEWRKDTESKDVMVLTKIQKLSGIKGLAIKVLNKLTDNNFEIQSSELLKVLCENKEKTSVVIIANLILEKVWYDKSFYKLYVKLCEKLWSNNDWITECYHVTCIEKGKKKTIKEYFYSLNFENTDASSKELILKGPFLSHDLAEEAALKMANFKSVFIAICRDNFYKRETFINEMVKLPDSNQKYKLKRRLYGTIEILGHFYEMGKLDENIIHYILLSLLHTDSNQSSGSKYEEEIETLKLLWDIVHKKIGSKRMSEYNNLLHVEEKRNWCSRINFMIDDMLTSNLNAKGSDINTWTKNKSLESKDNSIVNLFINNVNIEKNDNSRIKPEIKKTDISVINKSEVLNEKSENKSENKSEVLNEKIEKDIINLSRNFNNENKSEVLNEKIEKDIINLSRNFNNENKNDIFDLLKNVNKLSTFSMNIVSSIIKDSTEYGEYADNHSSTILSFLENYDISKLSFDNLSTAIAAAGEDMGDIKIDAPKAPKNMSFIIGKILKGTKTGKIEININKTTIMSNDISKYDDSKKEWDNILKLTENFIDKDTLINRFEILKYNN
jgi:hypothetical protein